MTTTEITTTEASETMRNGVDTATLFATLDAVKQAPEAAKFQFRAHNQWVSGTHNRTTIADYFGVGEERAHERTFVFDADHPAVLVGQDHGPTPAEFVLITVRFTIKGDAPAEKLREIVEQSRARSAVYDSITNGVPVAIEVDTP